MIDFAIIGGGIAGLSLGAKLAPHGSVLVIEAEDALGYHASGRSAAMFEETYGAPSVVELNRASKAEHFALDGGVLSPRGLLLVGGEDDAVFEADLKSMEISEITLEDACAMVPILNRETVKRAGYHAEAWDLDTDRVLQVHARTIRAHGGAVATGAKATAIEKHATGWRLLCGDTDYTARIICNAAGAWVDEVARMAGITPLGFTPLRRSIARIAAPGGHDVRAWPMMFGPGEEWYAKPDAGALLVSPANQTLSPPMDAWPEDMELAEGLALYEGNVTIPVTRPLASWAGLRTFAPDRQLVIGFDAQDPSFFWQAGQGGYGFQTAPAASGLGANLILDRASELPADLHKVLAPSRFS
jgi:glycine/D-amino acid oxidase-like deaminating enzyme